MTSKVLEEGRTITYRYTNKKVLVDDLLMRYFTMSRAIGRDVGTPHPFVSTGTLQREGEGRVLCEEKVLCVRKGNDTRTRFREESLLGLCT